MDLRCPLDELDDSKFIEAVLAFVKGAEEPRLTTNEIDNYYATITPRSVFFKNLPFGGSLLDLGAGDGTMVVFRDWPMFKRTDIRMYAVSLDVGAQFAKYDGYELVNFEQAFPNFDGRLFDAILCAHFIEHLKDPARCIRWMSERLKPGGRLYLEWPHAISKRMPRNVDVRHLKFNVTTINFRDDQTHVDTWDMNFICNLLKENGLAAEILGRTHYPYLAGEMRNMAVKTDKQVYGTFSIWGFVGWAQYIVASKSV